LVDRILSCGLAVLSSLATEVPPSEDAKKLKKILAVEQEETRETEQAMAQRRGQEELQKQIEDERNRRQELASQPATEKKPHGIEKRAKKVEKWAKKHGL
jgi:hypothetical protein